MQGIFLFLYFLSKYNLRIPSNYLTISLDDIVQTTKKGLKTHQWYYNYSSLKGTSVYNYVTLATRPKPLPHQFTLTLVSKTKSPTFTHFQIPPQILNKTYIHNVPLHDAIISHSTFLSNSSSNNCQCRLPSLLTTLEEWGISPNFTRER